MKQLFVFSLVCISTVTLAFANQSRHTASYFKGLAPEYIGKKISLDVAAVQPVHRTASDTYSFLIAQTFDTRNRTDGGKIFVVADKLEILALVRKFGTRPDVERARRGGTDVDTTRLTGVLRQTENQVLFLDIAEDEVPDDALKELKKAMSETKKPEPKRVPKGKGKPFLKKGGRKGK